MMRIIGPALVFSSTLAKVKYSHMCLLRSGSAVLLEILFFFWVATMYILQGVLQSS